MNNRKVNFRCLINSVVPLIQCHTGVVLHQCHRNRSHLDMVHTDRFESNDPLLCFISLSFIFSLTNKIQNQIKNKMSNLTNHAFLHFCLIPLLFVDLFDIIVICSKLQTIDGLTHSSWYRTRAERRASSFLLFIFLIENVLESFALRHSIQFYTFLLYVCRNEGPEIVLFDQAIQLFLLHV